MQVLPESKDTFSIRALQATIDMNSKAEFYTTS